MREGGGGRLPQANTLSPTLFRKHFFTDFVQGTLYHRLCSENTLSPTLLLKRTVLQKNLICILCMYCFEFQNLFVFLNSLYPLKLHTACPLQLSMGCSNVPIALLLVLAGFSFGLPQVLLKQQYLVQAIHNIQKAIPYIPGSKNIPDIPGY